MSETVEQDQIEENLRNTRSRMDRRLNELQDKLAPGQVVEDFFDYVRGNGGGQFGRNLLAAVQANPVPAVVAGVGIAWLIVSNNRPAATAPSSGARYQPYSDRPLDWRQQVRDAEGQVRRADDEPDDSFSERLDAARGHALGLARHAKESASGYADRIRTATSDGLDSVTRNLHDARDGAKGLAGQAASSVGQFGGQVVQGAMSVGQSGGDLFTAIKANPLALGAVGLAAGALLALTLPQSDQEEQALGGIATQARTAARDAAQSVVDKGTAAAQYVAAAAKESAGAHGFTSDRQLGDVVNDATSGDLVENAKQVARDVLGASTEAARNAAQPKD